MVREARESLVTPWKVPEFRETVWSYSRVGEFGGQWDLRTVCNILVFPQAKPPTSGPIQLHHLNQDKGPFLSGLF